MTTATMHRHPIGSATMRADGTLVLELIADLLDLAEHAQFIYHPGDLQYPGMLEHLGGLAPGERKLVPPFP